MYNNTASSFKLNVFSFRAGAVSGLQGVIVTLTSYYGQNGDLKDIFKGSSRWTLVAAGGVTIVSAVLWLVHYPLLKQLQQKHDNEYGKRRAGRRGEGTGYGNEKPPKIHSISESYGPSCSTVFP